MTRDEGVREPRARRNPAGARRAATLALSALAIFRAGSAWLALYPPVPVDLGGAPNLDADARRVSIPVAGDSLAGWVLEGRGTGVVAIFHGYGRDHHRAWRYARFLRAAGYSVVTVDFRSSRSARRLPTTLGRYELEDAAATLDWIARAPRLGSEPLALLGESLGGSVALVLASERPQVRAVLADCPFASGRRALEDTFNHWTGLPGAPIATAASAFGALATGHDPARLDVVGAAAKLAGRPLLLVQSARDDRMRLEQVRDIARAAGPDAVVWTVPEGHNEAWLRHRADYERRALALFGHALRGAHE